MAKNYALAIEALLHTNSTLEASKRCAIPVRTLHRWQYHDPKFQDEYRKVRAAMFQAATRVLLRKAHRLAEVLVEIAEDGPKANQTGRVTACLGALRLLADCHWMEDVEERLNRLEQLQVKQEQEQP